MEQGEKLTKSYSNFWNWFQKHEKRFYKVIKNKNNVVKNFINKLSPKLDKVKDGFFLLAGMYDDETAELIITADCNIENIVFVEELIEQSPKIKGWKFTALKRPMNINRNGISMGKYTFSQDNLNFYYTEYPQYPDEIDITVVHDDLTTENKKDITNGVYVFLDNYLGELNFATSIDAISVIGPEVAEKELIPISKLKDFLAWREKEFVEKYEAVRYDSEIDNCSIIEAKLDNGLPLIASVNTDLLNWDRKASHPWILVVNFVYDGNDHKGLPGKDTLNLFYEIENLIMAEIKVFDGYIYVGRETANGLREIYFACKDFRKPSKVLYQVQKKYEKTLEINYEIYKDKYWQTFDRFVVTD